MAKEISNVHKGGQLGMSHGRSLILLVEHTNLFC